MDISGYQGHACEKEGSPIKNKNRAPLSTTTGCMGFQRNNTFIFITKMVFLRCVCFVCFDGLYVKGWIDWSRIHVRGDQLRHSRACVRHVRWQVISVIYACCWSSVVCLLLVIFPGVGTPYTEVYMYVPRKCPCFWPFFSLSEENN